MNPELVNCNEMLRWQGYQRRIGLTGGIASGKSSVGKFLADTRGVPILDADLYAKQALAPETSLTKVVLDRYGTEVLSETECTPNTLDRSALANIIFSNRRERIWLETLVHPFVRRSLEKDLIKYQTSSVIILMIPLLFEANFSELCSEIWLVACTFDQQCQRLIKRDGITLTEARIRITSQWSIERKRIFADIVIDNSGPLNDWISQVSYLF